ncbi:hypothetical protein ACFL51_02035 [Myxococcota bacterium]
MPPDPTDEVVRVADVTLREHGQNVTRADLHRFDVDLRIATAKRLVQAGVRRLEVLSCVSPRIAPAMDASLAGPVAQGIGRPPGTRLVTLVPNRQGLETFLRLGLGADGLGHTGGVFFSAVEAHNRANLGRSVAESLEEIRAVAREAQQREIPLVGYVSAGFGFRPAPEKPVIPVDESDLRAYAAELFDLGAQTVTVSDLQGVAGPTQTASTLAALLEALPAEQRARLGYHPHHADRAAGLDLVEVAYDAGVRLFDASLGAAGGCVTGAPGNVPTEGVLERLEARGARTDIDLDAVKEAGAEFSAALLGSVGSGDGA